jgi:hypothetical protein
LAEGLYGRSFGATGTINKPPCYADVTKYDDSDAECRACPFRGTCRYQVEQKISRSQSAYTSTASTAIRPTTTQAATVQGSTSVPAPIADHLRTAVQAEDTFMGALAHNSFLSALEAVMHEAVYSVRSIPRRKYPNPFK